MRLELRFVGGPIAIDFPRAPTRGAAGRGEPFPNGVMRVREFVIAADVRGHGNFTGRSLRAFYFVLVRKRSGDLHAKVDVHCQAGPSGMMIDETIVSAGPQTILAMEKLPYEIKRRLPGPANVSAEHAPLHSGERLRTHGFGNNLIIHRCLLSYICPSLVIPAQKSEGEVDAVGCARFAIRNSRLIILADRRSRPAIATRPVVVIKPGRVAE